MGAYIAAGGVSLLALMLLTRRRRNNSTSDAASMFLGLILVAVLAIGVGWWAEWIDGDAVNSAAALAVDEFLHGWR